MVRSACISESSHLTAREANLAPARSAPVKPGFRLRPLAPTAEKAPRKTNPASECAEDGHWLSGHASHTLYCLRHRTPLQCSRSRKYFFASYRSRARVAELEDSTGGWFPSWWQPWQPGLKI